MKWKVVKLDEIKAPEKGALVSGPFGSNIGSRFFVATGVPVIRGNNLSMGQKRFIDDGFVFITEDKARELRNCNAKSDDIIFTAAGTLGQVGLMPKIGRFESYIISNKQIRLRLDTNQAFPLFAYYFLSSPDMRAFIASQNKGSSVPLLTLGIIRNLKIPLPPITTQKRIAAVLSAYDELIENNQRRIALLEKMAEEIYREWFVRMRFPGHEQVKKVKGVPEGWRAVLFTEVCEFQKGKTPDQIFFDNQDGLLPYITVEFTEGKNTGYVLKKWNSIVCENGDVLMLMDGARSGLVFRGEKGIVGSTFARIAVEPLYRDVVYEFLRATREHIVSNNTGSAIPHANKEFIHRLVMFLPENENLIEKFNNLYRNLFEQMLNLARQNELLLRSRDALLPRLISSKLSVEHLDIQFPPGMEDRP